MTDTAADTIDALAAEFPQFGGAIGSISDVLGDLLGSDVFDSQFVDVFMDLEGSTLLVEAAFVSGPLTVSLPGLGGFSVSVGEGDGFELDLALILSLTGSKGLLLEAPIHVRCLTSDLLVPVVQVGDQWLDDLDNNGVRKPFGLVFDGVDLSFDSNGGFQAATDLKIDVPPARIGDTGLVIGMRGLYPCLSDNSVLPQGIPAGSRGFAMDGLDVWLPESLQGSFAPGEIVASDLFVGTGGFTGKLSGAWTSGKPIAFAGLECTLKSLLFEFVQNALVASKLECEMVLPFFDQPVDVEIALSASGDITVGLSSSNGLKTLLIPSASSVLEIEIDSLEFEVESGKLTTTLSGKLTPTCGGLDWPSFDVKALKIDSEGNVALSGGWLDLPKQYSLDFHGFTVEITKFGYGRNDDGSKWIGFSGGVELVKGLPAGASVDGLRITADDDWSNPRFSFDGVGVELEIPDVLQFKGEVAFKEFTDDDGGKVRRFDGDITLKLDAIDLQIDGTIVAGTASGYNFFAIYVAAELPVGFPVGPSGIALYGVSGLLALQMAPDRAPDQAWYGFGPDEDGWYDEDPRGIEKLKDKWTNVRDSRAFGAGVTLGTLSDNGYTFNGQVLLALVLPGPIVMLQGAANVLKERSPLSDDAMFKTLAVFDKPAGNILFGVDATYKYDDPGGKLVTINGSLEAYYSYVDQSDWHLYIGKNEPRTSRVQARVLDLFDANAYFMLDSRQLAMGSWIGFDRGWQFGPLSVTLQAWMENNALISFKPLHLHGDLWVHGSVDLKVFKFGAGLSVDARIEADVYQPMHLLGDFRVAIRLPRPFKSISADIRLEWGPQAAQPPTPIVLKDVAIEHLKSSAKWALPSGVLVVPNYDDGSGFLNSGSLPGGDLTPQAARALASDFDYPVVPMDCRPSIAFGRNVWDRALVGTLPQPPEPAWETVGDPARNQGPARVQYSLESVSLEKYDGSSWQTVAAATGNGGAAERLFGSWQLTTNVGGAGGPAQNKLLLWSKSGYDLYRNTGAGAVAQLADAFGEFPCITMPEAQDQCLDFDRLSPRERFSATFLHPENFDVSFGLAGPGQLRPSGIAFPNVAGHFSLHAPAIPTGTIQVLCPTPSAGVWIAFAQPVANLRIAASSPGGGQIKAWVIDGSGAQSGPFSFVNGAVTLPTPDVRRVTLVPDIAGDSVCLAKVCALMPPSQALLDAYADMAERNAQANAHWSDQGHVLEPFTDYRLVVRTGANMVATDSMFSNLRQPLQYAYFQTGGPPGIGRLSVPKAGDAANFDSGLDDLTRYVRQTVPQTVPRAGAPTASPRPVYCGYDVKVHFNENYVSLMYRMAGRDLSLLLYDPNNRPVRDLAGAVAVADNGWGTAAETFLSDTDQAWLASLGSSPCVTPVDATGIAPDETLAASHVELKPDTRYEARLIPSLLRDAFDGHVAGTQALGPNGRFGRWQVFDLSSGGASLWRVDVVPGGGNAQRVGQHAQIGAASLTGSTQPPGGSLLILGPDPAIDAADSSQPASWADCRISALLRMGPANVVGLAFRMASGSGYLVTFDGPTRNLLRIDPAGTTLLASETALHSPNQDYRIVVECMGNAFRVTVDGEPSFDETDPTLPSLAQGGIGLFSSGGPGAAFSDLQVFDLSPNARPAYSFSFTTSPYLDFRHHLHSFNDGCWRTDAGTLDMAALQALASVGTGDITADITAVEGLAFEALAADVLGPSASQEAQRVEIHRIERLGSTGAFLVRGPQPFGFSRNQFELSKSLAETPTSIFPLHVKLESVTLNVQSTQEECVVVLLREATDLAGYRIELRTQPQNSVPVVPLNDPGGVWTPLFIFPPQVSALPAGHRAVIRSCSPSAAPPQGPKSVDFFRAANGQTETLVLNLAYADLRLVDPSGSVVHARRFLDDDDFGPVNGCTFLRKHDETAFVVFPATGQILEPASYRLAMRYLRDNTAFDPSSQILAEAGDSTTERAELDFSWTAFN